MAAVSNEGAPRHLQSILRKRTSKPAPRYSAFSSVPALRRLLRATGCGRRRRERITFCASAEVAEFSKAISLDSVPGDGTHLAVGLGSLTWKGRAPLITKRPTKPVEESVYLPIEERERMMMIALGPGQYHQTVTHHLEETAQLIQRRQKAVEDPREPPQLMPTSYEQACDRAQKVAEAVRTAAVDLQLSPKIAKARLTLARPPSPCFSSRNREAVDAMTKLPAVAPSTTKHQRKVHRRKRTVDAQLKSPSGPIGPAAGLAMPGAGVAKPRKCTFANRMKRRRDQSAVDPSIASKVSMKVARFGG